MRQEVWRLMAEPLDLRPGDKGIAVAPPQLPQPEGKSWRWDIATSVPAGAYLLIVWHGIALP